MKTSNVQIRDVRASLKRVRERGHFLAAWEGEKVFTKDRYTGNVGNTFGFLNHFQGLVRLGRHVVISGGDKHRPASELYVIRMASRKVTQPFRSNLWKSTQPPDGDLAVKRLHVDSELWHAGGIDASGDLVVVPLEGGALNSRVVFYDFSDPEQPALLKRATIERTVNKASAAALAQRGDGRLVVAVWWYDTRRRLDFYLSRTGDPTDGFEGPATLVLDEQYRYVAYQAIQFLQQADGALFLLGFDNTAENAPIQPGVDLCHLWRVTVPAGGPAGGVWPGLGVEHVDWRPFTCKDRQANMDAGAGTWIDPTGELHVYSCYHWRQDRLIRFSEFRAQPVADAAPITEPSKSWIDLYEHKAFGGHCLALVGLAGNNFAQYEHLHVEGSHFNEKVSSIRYQIPPGHTYRLFKEPGYTGSVLDLVGTGAVVEIEDLGAHAAPLRGDQASSSKWL